MRDGSARLRVPLVLAGCATLVALVLLAAMGARSIGPAASPSMSALTGDQLFDLSRVWAIQLHLTPEAWAAIEPEQTGHNPEPGDPGPARSGPPADGPAGPGMAIATTIVKTADTDRDGTLSRTERSAFTDKLFVELDLHQAGALDADTLQKGLPLALGFPGLGGPGGGGPGMAGPLGLPMGPPPGMPEGLAPGAAGPPPGGPGLPGIARTQGGRNGMAGMAGLDYPTVHGDVTFNSWPFPGCTLRYKGNNTFMDARGTLKRSLKVDLNDAYPGRRLGGATKLNLHNNVADPSWMNEPLSYQLFREAGVPAPRTSYARVYLSVPGQFDHQYLGLYSIVENIDNAFARDRFGTTRGAIFKPVVRSPFDDLGDSWSEYRQAYDPKTPVSDREAARVIAFAKFVSHASDADFAARVGEFLDLDEFARFMAVTVWLSNTDSLLGMGQNYVVYLHPMTGLFLFLPWDLDHSFGQFMSGPGGSAQLDIQKPWTGSIRFLERVFAVPRFGQLYFGYLREFSRTIFQPAQIRHQVDVLAPILRTAVAEESSEKAARFDRAVANPSAAAAPGSSPTARLDPFPAPPPDGVGPRGLGGPAGPGGVGGSIKSFVDARAQSVAEQLSAAAGRPSRQGATGGASSNQGPAGPASAFAAVVLGLTDANHDGRVSRAEFSRGMANWLESLDADHSGALTDEELSRGLARTLPAPMPGRQLPGAGPAGQGTR
jgi:spore coat protein H